MKDLRDYYKTPPKTVIEVKDEGGSTSSSAENTHSDKNVDESQKETPTEPTEAQTVAGSPKKSLTPVGASTTCDRNEEQEPTSKEEKENAKKGEQFKQKRKGRKSRASRKISDPAVKGITELLNASLTIISPNTSLNASIEKATHTSKEKQSPLTKQTRSPRASSVQKKPRRSSSDFETPKPSKKHKSKLSMSCKKVNDKTSSENYNDDGSTKSKRKSQTSNFNKSDTVEKGKTESEQNHKSQIEDDKIVDVTDNTTAQFSDNKSVNNKNNAHTKSESSEIKEKSKPSNKEKVTEVNKMPTEAINNSTKANNNVINEENEVEKVVVIDGDESLQSDDINQSSQSQETPKPKINAFQFMMESRFKSIGQNLSGKDLDTNEVAEDEKEKQEKRLSRKISLENWAESKTNVKRKRIEEEEKDNYISYQLEKRAKRLKKLLNLHDDNTKENVKEKPAVEKEKKRKSLRKRIVKPVIDSDSESSGDFVQERQNKNKSQVSRDKSLKDKDNNKTSITSKEGSSNRNSLLNFLGITDKLKMENFENKDAENEENTSSEMNISKKLKLEKTPKKAKLESSNNTRELVIEENANLDLPIAQNQQHHVISQVGAQKQESQSSIDETILNGSSVDCHSSVDTCEKSCSQDSIGTGFQTPKPKKHKRRETIENYVTGRSPCGWKMKIRLTDDEATSTGDSFAAKKEVFNQESDKETNEKKESNSEHTEEVRAERPRRKAASKVLEVILSSDSDEEFEIISPQKKPGKSSNKKLAPVFVKAAPKPKIDPKVIQARREFLMSGVPDQLKKDIERQISLEDIEVEVFPIVSHVQQKSSDNIYWDMQLPELKLTPLSPLKSDSTNLIYHKLTVKHINETISFCRKFQKLEVCKQFIEQIKSKNPSYPVYKCFKSIYEKSGLQNKKVQEKSHEENSKNKTPKKKRGRKKKENLDKSVEIIETPKEEFNVSDFATWTEKYKPTSCSDIIGNMAGVAQLKKWLERWKDSDESVLRRKRKRNASTSDSEFEFTDGDSRGSTCDSKNIVILNGPNGSGKTSAVYAICTELGMNVLELNASSKRTGKKLLQQLQEATQSHQVMKGESTALSQFIKVEKTKEKSQSEGNHSDRNKICVLLVEDIDIIFEQDEGFLSALNQLIATSKRPIILTTTDNTSPVICRFTTQYTVVDFKPLAERVLSVWLHILCLIEGVSVDVQSIGHLLEKNNGDVRKTMLELQYWVQSGGNIREDNQESVFSVRNAAHKRCSSEDKLDDDDNSNLTFVIENAASQDVLESHTGCLESFEVTSHEKPFSIPYKMSLSKIWWNLPQIMALQSSITNVVEKDNHDNSETTPDEQQQKHGNTADVTVEEKKNKRLGDRKRLDAICQIYDSLLYTDVAKRGKDCLVDLEPCPKQWENALKDSLELTENLDNYSSSPDLTEDICHTLVDGCIHLYKKDNQTSYSINMGLPSIREKRWREKQHLCEDILQDALSYSSYVNRRAVSVDYMPILRQMGRSEMTRYSQNSKRGSRFNHYLRGLGIDGGDSSYKIVCNVLNVEKIVPS